MKVFADDNFKFDEIGRKLSKMGKKMLVTSNFSFSQSVSKRFVLQTHKNQGLFKKGLTIYPITATFNNPVEQHFGKHSGKKDKKYL